MKCTLDLIDCPHLRTLEGIDGFLSANPGLQITITVLNCPSLEFDPYDYRENAKFEFWYDVPRNVRLVKAIAFLASDQVVFRNLRDSTLDSILSKGRAMQNNAPGLALDLFRAGYRHHVLSRE